MKRLSRFSLVQLFVAATLAVALAIGTTSYVFLESSRRAIVQRSDRLRDSEALRIGARLSDELGVAATTLDETETAIHFGALRADDPVAVETRLFSQLLAHATISDASWTHTTLPSRQAGSNRVPTGERWQISVFRSSPDRKSAIVTRRVSLENGRFVSDVRSRPPGASLFAVPFERRGDASDPTVHPTFETSISEEAYGRAIWSDLSFSDLDADLPKADRRIVVTVQRAIEDEPGHFAGVLRIGLSTQRIDELPRLSAAAPQRVFICDAQGRLVARLSPGDRIEALGDDLRVQPAEMPAEIGAALATRSLRMLSKARPERSEPLVVAGVRYLATFRELENTQEWIAAVVVPEEYYTGDLRALQRRFSFAIIVATGIVLVAGGLVLHQLRRSLGRVVAATARMRHFDFSASAVDAPLREMSEVMQGVERAKTSMRALEKYVPIDLVRELYESNREPELGGTLVEISLMFSDIEGFTALSERIAPDSLAKALGGYLEAMTGGIRSTNGTVDKFIGDSVMAFWNAPSPCPDHARRACLAVLACMRATRELYASPSWAGLPPLFTRFGLHRAKVMVGHFGAPERLSYTALGDGVNLASRLEGLCKLYGVATLVSETIAIDVGDEFAFRFIDRVAVKGKTEAIRVYELLGLRAECAGEIERAKTYEEALEAYFSRDFPRVLVLLRRMGDDRASGVLIERCTAMLVHPPPPEWNGVYVATAK